MKKNGKRTLFGTVLVCGVALASILAHAQDVTVAGQPCVLHVAADVEGAAEESREVSSFRIYGQAGTDRILIRILKDGLEESQDLYVSSEELLSLFPQLEPDRFPDVEGMSAISAESGSETVSSMQEVLAKLGFLTGTVDGVYGGGTAEAVRKFQEAHGLEGSGAADAYTVMLLAAAAEGIEDSIEVVQGGYETPEEKFPEIAGKTEADLEPFMDGKWRFNFDVFEEKGSIDPSIEFGSFEVSAPAIDRIEGTMSIRVMVERDESTKNYVLTPAVAVETTGAYRPYVQAVILVGDDTVRTEGGRSSGEVEGATLKESGYVPLNEEAIELLKGGSVHTVRLEGKNTDYEAEVEFDADKMASFMEACETLVD